VTPVSRLDSINSFRKTMSERQHDPAVQAQHQGNLQQAQQMAPSYSERREYLEAVIEDELDDATVGMLRNMTSADFILSNFNEAEINEIKKLREITYKKVVAAHPSDSTIMQGNLREQIYDNGAALRPLSQNQKVLIDQYIRGAFARLVRSREGFQQEQFGKTISASETRQPNKDDSGGILPW
jgi:hypothetical protein